MAERRISPAESICICSDGGFVLGTGKSCSGSAPVDRFLNIRRLADEVHARLRLRAAHNGRSMQAGARDILDRVCAADYQAPEGSGLRRISQD